MPRIRVVLDTNVLVSGAVYPDSTPGKILQLSRTGGVELALSHYILDELARALPRFPRFSLAPEEIYAFIDGFFSFTHLVEPDAVSDPVLRDPADQQILATFRAANADYLITGDKDLLALADRYPILTPAQFWSRHG